MRLSIFLLVLLLSSCTLKLKLRGKCDGSLALEQAKENPIKKEEPEDAESE